MLHGRRVDLRARAESDVEVLHAELYDDVAGFSRADGRAWRPHPRGLNSPFAPKEPSSDVADFTVVLHDGGDVLGRALLWGIDRHNRLAHIGLALRPSYRGRSYRTEVVEVVEVLCADGFAMLGLHRLQIETLSDNAAMIAAATANGFQVEGTLRGSSWLDGAFADDVVLGLLDGEWRARPSGTATATT